VGSKREYWMHKNILVQMYTNLISSILSNLNALGERWVSSHPSGWFRPNSIWGIKSKRWLRRWGDYHLLTEPFRLDHMDGIEFVHTWTRLSLCTSTPSDTPYSSNLLCINAVFCTSQIVESKEQVSRLDFCLSDRLHFLTLWLQLFVHNSVHHYFTNNAFFAIVGCCKEANP